MHTVIATLLLGASLTGIVRDARTHSPLPLVRVQDVRSHLTTVTDSSGHFSLESSAPTRLRFSRDGYAAVERDIVPRARRLSGAVSDCHAARACDP